MRKSQSQDIDFFEHGTMHNEVSSKEHKGRMNFLIRIKLIFSIVKTKASLSHISPTAFDCGSLVKNTILLSGAPSSSSLNNDSVGSTRAKKADLKDVLHVDDKYLTEVHRPTKTSIELTSREVPGSFIPIEITTTCLDEFKQ